MLDTTRTFETPEGIELQMQVAGPVVRACAWLVDNLIRSVIYLFAFYVFSFLGNIGTALTFLSVFALEWLYPVVFEVTTGTTPGKKAFKLIVCHDNGTPISWQASAIRNLLRVADFLPFFYGTGLVTMLSNDDFKRLGDLVAGTIVIYQQTDDDKYYEIPDLAPVAPSVPLNLTEQRAILDFAERSTQLSKARVKELANILNAYTGLYDEKAVERLYANANWLQKGIG